MLSQLAYAVIWSGRIPAEAQPVWARQMTAPHGIVVSARMATAIGRAGADLLRADAEGRPDEIRTTVSGIVTAAFLLKPEHVLDALEDVLERLDVDVRDGVCPDVAGVPALIEEDIDRLIDARAARSSSAGVSSSDCSPAAGNQVSSVPGPHTWGMYGLSGLDRWSGLPEPDRFETKEASLSGESAPAKTFIHPSCDWSLDDLIAIRLQWNTRRTMGMG
jgi:hypothetical protein